MSSFLYRIAEVYYSQYQEKISEFTFVFPNRRAGIFFQHDIAEIAQKPIFSPEILTIEECFASASSLLPADQISLIFLLYQIYCDISKSNESFDTFVFWGEMLLNDFDEIDKYLVNPQQLFTNVTELKQIDQQFKTFSEEQIKAIKQFWKNFIPFPAEKVQENFVSLWKILYPLYITFRSELLKKNVATEGIIYRLVAEKIINGETILQWENKQFVFIGFNALNACEKTLFSYLKKREQADFYWDYEAAELRDEDNPASHFYKENMQMFPSKFTLNSQQETLSDKKIELIAVPSLVGQAKQTYELLDKLYPSDASDHEWIKTAVVLPNETLLTPLLYSLPPQIKKVNVTMGLPLNITPVQGLLEHIFELQRRMRITDNQYLFYHQTVSNLLNHQYITLLCGREAQEIQTIVIENNLIYVDADVFKNDELLATIFTPQEDTKNFLTYLLQILVILQKKFQQISETSQSYQLEYNFTSQYYLTLRRLNEVIKENASAIEMSLDTLMRLIVQITASLTIPFVGEPLEGLQIMGVLETRGLDFDNLIITSFNEDFFPKKTTPNSFIPYNLRRGFGLPTIEHQEAIFSYNFYRLIHHAKHIFLLYDSRTEGLQKGEVSRFLHQLQYHYKVPFTTKNVLYDISFKNSPVLQIEKNASVLEKLKSFLNNQPENRALSASSINTYIDCPLQFYLTYVEGLKEADEVKETIEYDMFGTLFHSSMEFLYQPFKNKLVNSSDLEKILKDSVQIEIAIQKAFSEKYFNKKEDYQNIKLEGNYLLVANVLKKYIIQLLKIDKFYAPFKYLGSEKEFHLEFPLQNGQEKVNLKGIIDRIDEKEGRLRIIDYKTGNGSLTFKNIEEVFAHEANNRPKYILQTFLYSMLYKYKSNTLLPIQPEIYYIKNLFKNDFTSQLTLKPNKEKTIIIEDFNSYEEEFKNLLTNCLEEIFNPAIPFYQTTNNKLCQYCPYQSICDRQ